MICCPGQPPRVKDRKKNVLSDIPFCPEVSVVGRRSGISLSGRSGWRIGQLVGATPPQRKPSMGAGSFGGADNNLP